MIAIIGVLAAILIPTVQSVRSRAWRTQCATSLRQFGTALALYRNERKGTLPDGATPNTNLQWISTTMRDDLMRYGLSFDMFYCNGNQDFKKTWMTEAQRTKVGSNGIAISYIYLPGTATPITTPSGRISTVSYRDLVDSRIRYRLIATDLNRIFNGTFAGGTNHSANDLPVGGNHLYLDGSVRWYNYSEFNAHAAVNVGGGSYYFKADPN